jgi:hypothetical protein
MSMRLSLYKEQGLLSLETSNRVSQRKMVLHQEMYIVQLTFSEENIKDVVRCRERGTPLKRMKRSQK